MLGEHDELAVPQKRIDGNVIRSYEPTNQGGIEVM